MDSVQAVPYDPNSCGTPKWLKDWCFKNFNIVGDVAASPSNALFEQYITRDENALICDWTNYWTIKYGEKRKPFLTGRGYLSVPANRTDAYASIHSSRRPVTHNAQIGYVICNPPYGKKDNNESNIKIWTAKADSESARGGVGVILIVPAPDGQKGLWGKHVAEKASIIYNIEGRVAFKHPVTGEERKHTAFGSVVIVYDPVLRIMNTPYDTVFRALYPPGC
jgi:hypothetical protein